jgi:hypothetical protein
LFEINTDTGRLSLKNPLNDNSKSEYGVIVKAYQENNPLKSALVMVNIEILNVNEYAPVFEKSSYEIKLKENTKLGTLIGRIQAEDRDKNRIEYSILNNHESPFIIDKYKGIIFVNGRLDYEMKSNYLLDVIASDGNFTSQTVVKIDLINMVDKEPYFEFNNYSFKLKIPYDVYIGQVRAIDVEKTEDLKYSLKFNDSTDSILFCISQNGIIYICPSVHLSSIQPPANKSNSINYFALNSLNDNNDEEIRTKFKKKEYKFNVSARIYSRDLLVSLENHVECKIEIEYSSSSSSSSSNLIDSINYNDNNETNLNSNLKSFSPPVFLSDRFFKDTTTMYVFTGILVTSIVLLVFCASGIIWFKYTRSKQNSSKNKRNNNLQHRHDQCDHYFHNKAPFRNMFNTMNEEIETNNNKTTKTTAAAPASTGIDNGCFISSSASSISDSNSSSCKNSTSGISCLSDGSTFLTNSKFNLIDLKKCINHNQSINDKKKDNCDCSFKLSSIKALDYLKWQEKNRSNGINVDTSSGSESTPTSKLTILSEYFSNESQFIKSAKLMNDLKKDNNTKVSVYSDILSSTASTLKNMDTPILIRQIENHKDDSSNQFFQIINNQNNNNNNFLKNKKKIKPRNFLNENATTSFRPGLSVKKSSIYSSTSSSSSSSSSKCNSPKLPVAVSLEKNRNMFSFIYNYREPLTDNFETNLENKSIYEDIKTEFKDTNCINKKNELEPYLDIAPISDSSFISASVDNKPTDEVNFLNEDDLYSNNKKIKMHENTNNNYLFESKPPPDEFKDTVCMNEPNLITNLNIISINQNRMDSNSTQETNFHMPNSRINQLKKCFETDFFFNSLEIRN